MSSDVPAAVQAVAGGESLTLVWQNNLGGLTYRLGESRFIKWVPIGVPELDIGGEIDRLRWARPYAQVPAVVESGFDADGSWMVTEALPGQSAVAPRWVAEPATAVAAIGHGLRSLHDALPVVSCPFSWSVDVRLAELQLPAEQREYLTAPPTVDRLVVCHGDPCAPNTLLDDDGGWAGHVDLAALGVADRWADLAVALWTVEANYGPLWMPALLDTYGIDPDPTRATYYRQLWDLKLS